MVKATTSKVATTKVIKEKVQKKEDVVGGRPAVRKAKAKVKDGKSKVGLTRPSVTRLTRRAGVARHSSNLIESINPLEQVYLSRLTRSGSINMNTCGRKTFTSKDVAVALEYYPIVYGENFEIYGTPFHRPVAKKAKKSEAAAATPVPAAA